MDDLNGLDWSTAPSNAKRGPAGTMNYYSAVKQTIPPRNFDNSLPIPNKSPGYGQAPQKSSQICNTKATDSFSNLVSFGSSKVSTLTLLERQQELDAEKQKQATQKQRQLDMQFGNSQFWDGIETSSFEQKYNLPDTYQKDLPVLKSSIDSRQRPVSPPAVNGSAVVGYGADKDLFAAFNSETKVDVSSYYPPPDDFNKERNILDSTTEAPLDLSKPQAWGPSGTSDDLFGNDDDPFGLSEVNPSLLVPSVTTLIKNDEDLLGDLGKPIEELRRQETPKIESLLEQESRHQEEDSWGKAIAELVKMGFSVEQSQRALIESDSELDIGAAVNWILSKTQNKTYNQNPSDKTSGHQKASDIFVNRNLDNICLTRVQTEQSFPQVSKLDPKKPREDLDILRDATVVGSNLLKTANSLWKISQKKVHKVVSEIQQHDSVSDPNQPKWMRNSDVHRDHTKRISASGRVAGEQPNYQDIVPDRNQPKWMRDNTVRCDRIGRFSTLGERVDSTTQCKTDEALMLEMCDKSQINVKAPIKKRVPKSSHDQQLDTFNMLQPSYNSESRLWHYREKEIKERQTEQNSENVYTSPARRKKGSLSPSPTKINSEVLFIKPSNYSSASFTPKPPIPIHTRSKALSRKLPQITTEDYQLSTQYRLAGNSHFKRGDFASANESYSSSIDALPTGHPINIILLCNRALTSLKNGLPKSAILDADKALNLIGETRGDNETIDLGPGQGGSKEMKTYYEKALLRKAEALEQMERWKDAGEIWRKCVEQGVGGSIAVEGRTRCNKLLGSEPASVMLDRIAPQIELSPKPSRKFAVGVSTGDSVAVKRLREANEKAELADNQKLELIDKVDARIAHWRDGKRDNLRALIGSLDGVLWEGSGWKSVGLHELIQNSKVKIYYMKAIGKTHPDKLPQDASMEVRMIAAQVFATLNETWDRFKQQNGM